MISVTQTAKGLQQVFTEVADRLGHELGFIKRIRAFTGASFIQTLVFGWLANGEATLGELNQAAATVEVEVSAQGIDQRFTPAAAEFVKAVLDAAVEWVIGNEPVAIPLLQRFAGVYVLDSSVISLPDVLADLWPGCGGSHGESAALKAQASIELKTGRLRLLLQSGREHDQQTPLQTAALPVGSLRIADLGYFKLAVLRDYAQQGVFWLTRHKVGTHIYDEHGEKLDLGALLRSQQGDKVDMTIQLGAKERISCRFVAVRLPSEKAAAARRRMKKDAKRRGQTVSQARLALCDWLFFVTNVPFEMLSFDEVLVLARVRWQIELLFKLWKSEGQLDKSRSQNPWRVLCEIYAKLIAMIVQHWLFLVTCWVYPNRSLTKAAQTVRKFAFSLAANLSDLTCLAALIAKIQRCLAAGCRMNTRKSAPNTYQLLLGFENAA